MFRKSLLPLLALAGVAVAALVIVRGGKTMPPSTSVSAAPQSPYPNFVAGSGIVEAGSENIAIGTHVAGVVAKILVEPGSFVKMGDPLFAVDDRAQRADLQIRQGRVQLAEAQLAAARYELNLDEFLTARMVTSVQERERDRFAVKKADAELAQAQAELAYSATELNRLTVRAPADGQVLQLKVHLGEYATAGALQQPLIVFGSTSPLHLRVDVDENDAWRVRAGAAAQGYLRGNREIGAPLQFVRFEPYVVPKKSLTGDSTERVDTRVLQVIFSFDRGDLPIYVGQQMDVFIETVERTRDSRATATESEP
jgi:RND family efflux transporter MFP subunit